MMLASFDQKQQRRLHCLARLPSRNGRAELAFDRAREPPCGTSRTLLKLGYQREHEAETRVEFRPRVRPTLCW